MTDDEKLEARLGQMETQVNQTNERLAAQTQLQMSLNKQVEKMGSSVERKLESLGDKLAEKIDGIRAEFGDMRLKVETLIPLKEQVKELGVQTMENTSKLAVTVALEAEVKRLTEGYSGLSTKVLLLETALSNLKAQGEKVSGVFWKILVALFIGAGGAFLARFVEFK